MTNIDKRWEEVKEYYEKAYGIKFRHRLSDKKIRFLHAEMEKLFRCLNIYVERSRPSIVTLVENADVRHR